MVTPDPDHNQTSKQVCFAAYWEYVDYHRAIIADLYNSGSTAVVTFTKYSSHEEVHHTDDHLYTTSTSQSLTNGRNNKPEDVP